MIGWLAETAIATIALMLLVLALRRPVAASVGATWAYALWLLPVLRLVTPPLEFIDPELPPLAVAIGAGEATASLPPIGGPGQWVPILLAVWAGGAVVFLLWQTLSYRAFLRRAGADHRSGNPAVFAGLPVLESGGIDGPLAIGLLRPRILVPSDFLSRYAPDEQQLALQHEWIHHRRGDLWWNLVALGLLAAHWWNPIAWIAFRAFRADQELSCDARVLCAHPEIPRHAYGQALVKSASRPGLLAACPLNEVSQLKRRLKMMNSHRVTRLRSLAGALVVTGIFAAGLGLSAPSLAQEAEPKKERRVIIREIGADGKRELPSEIRELTSKCPEAQRLESDVRSGTGDGEQRTRIILCNKDGQAPTAATRERLVAALDRARGEIGASKELSPERRAQAVEALRQEIERVRSGGK